MRLDHGTTLVVLRHGQTDWNAQRRFQGQADVRLNATGVAQAKAMRAALARFRFDAVWSSPLSRAYGTARIVAPEAQIRQDPRLEEINVGTWSGRTWEEIIAEMPDYEQHYANGVDFRRSPSGETLAELVERGRPALLEIAQAHEDESVLVVSHGLILNRLIHSLLDVEGRVLGSLENAHYSELGYAHGAWRLLSHNVGP